MLNRTIETIGLIDNSLRPTIQAHLDDLTKPRGSLGRLEEMAMQFCLATHTTKPILEQSKIFCFAGDHGVADDGVSAFPKEVTSQMVANMTMGGAAINILARHGDIGLDIVDMGVAADLSKLQGVIDRKVAMGTQSIAHGPAMTDAQCTQALEAGIALAQEAATEGITLLGTGDMGIANTTPSAALFCAYLGLTPEDIVGRGTGIDDERLRHKIAIVNQALTINAPRLSTPLGILAALGGFEIAGIAGLILGAAAAHVPVVVDGFISSAGALAACRIAPQARDYLFFSHLSQEKGHATFASEFGVRPLLDLELRLGEGTGAAMAIPMISAAIRIYHEMATFSAAGVSEEG